MIKVILGLGNPGTAYRNHRHNIGHLVVDAYLQHQALTFPPARKPVQIVRDQHQALWLAKNKTYMNQSGLAARALRQKLSVQPSEMLIVYDDLDLPLGKLRLRTGGSAGGHRGMQSVIEYLGGAAVPRLRLGIGPQTPGVPSEDFVLSAFRQEELPLVTAVIQSAVNCLLTLPEHDFADVMSQCNRTDLRPADNTHRTATSSVANKQIS